LVISRENSYRLATLFSLSALITLYAIFLLLPFWTSTLVAIFVFIAFLAFFVEANPIASIPILGTLFVRFTELAGCSGIEAGGYLTETDTYGKLNGATISLATYYILFFWFFSVGYNFCQNQFGKINPSSKTSNKFEAISLIFSIIVIGCGIHSGLTDGYAFLLAINRFTFRNQSFSAELNFFLTYRSLSAILLGLVFARSKNRLIRVFSLVLFVGILLNSFLHGEQFSSTIILTTMFFIGPFLKSALNKKRILKSILPWVTFAAVLGSAAIILIYSNSTDDVFSKTLSRFFLQGQLWYIVYNSSAGQYFFGNLSSAYRNIESFAMWNYLDFAKFSPPYGMRELMFKFAPGDIFDSFMSGNITFTMGQFAMLLYWFGFLGMIPWILLTAFLFGGAVYYFCNCLMKAEFVRIFFACKILTLFTFALAQGEYWFIFGLKSLLIFLSAFIYEVTLKAIRQSAGTSAPKI